MKRVKQPAWVLGATPSTARETRALPEMRALPETNGIVSAKRSGFHCVKVARLLIRFSANDPRLWNCLLSVPFARNVIDST